MQINADRFCSPLAVWSLSLPRTTQVNKAIKHCKIRQNIKLNYCRVKTPRTVKKVEPSKCLSFTIQNHFFYSPPPESWHTGIFLSQWWMTLFSGFSWSDSFKALSVQCQVARLVSFLTVGSKLEGRNSIIKLNGDFLSALFVRLFASLSGRLVYFDFHNISRSGLF